ncbi:MAG: cytochrome bc1 complex diheme cytochrome c subunit [Acidimicrobiales bacterium]
MGLRTIAATFALAGAACAGVLGAGAAKATPRPAVSGSPLPDGGFLYGRDCAYCHGSDGRGTPRGSRLVGVGAASADFMLTTGRMPLDYPGQVMRRRGPRYRPEEVAALDAFVAALGDGPPVPSVAPGTGSLAEGGELYRLNCSACHGFAGIGGALITGQAGPYIPYAPALLSATPVQIAEAMRTGPGTMPRFGRASFDQQQLDSIVAYVLYLHRPRDRGGQSLGHTGPVSEGAVAWILGLGALVLVIRRLGVRNPGG